VLDVGLDVVEHHEELGKQRLEGRAVAVVLVDRLDHRFAMLLEHLRKLVEVFHALGVIGLGRGEVGSTLALEAGLHRAGNGDLDTG
jgi:hypothetical protein